MRVYPMAVTEVSGNLLKSTKELDDLQCSTMKKLSSFDPSSSFSIYFKDKLIRPTTLVRELDFSPFNATWTTTTVWVRFPTLPIEFYDKESLCRDDSSSDEEEHPQFDSGVVFPGSPGQVSGEAEPSFWSHHTLKHHPKLVKQSRRLTKPQLVPNIDKIERTLFASLLTQSLPGWKRKMLLLHLEVEFIGSRLLIRHLLDKTKLSENFVLVWNVIGEISEPLNSLMIIQ
ncbi:hypothetical protein ACH5RR_029193 [Cinchona calisaya]|uniref:DUF4283 domain-containing protein n=1 Tax=Cinchona calisaya TaxID=153742 RepID=A0ABD2YVD8_9GENT